MSKKFVKRLEERNKVLRMKVAMLAGALEKAQERNKKNVEDFDRLGSVLYDSDPVAYSKHFRSL